MSRLGDYLFKYADIPGLPDRKNFDPVSVTDIPKMSRFVLQKHPAKRAGDHYDLRLLDPDTGVAHSWATKKEMPKPGDPGIIVFRQPTHTKEYMNYEGEIRSTYGKTRDGEKIKKVIDSDVEILRSGDNHIRFNLYNEKYPEEFILVKDKRYDKGWYLKNITPTKDKYNISNVKPKYKLIDDVEFNNPRQIFSSKIDGAHNLMVLDPGKHPRLFSYRDPARAKSGLIEHTHKLEDLYRTKVPKDVKKMIVRGEIWGKDKKGAPLELHQIGGILNSSVMKSRSKQQELGSLKMSPFDVYNMDGGALASSFKGRIAILQDLVKKMPQLELPEFAYTEEQKRALYSSIKNKQHGQTHEGIIVHEEGKKTPMKLKFRDEYPVYVRGIIEEIDKHGKPKGSMGSLEYSLSPDGEVIGRVGTGFSRSQREEIFKNKNKYIGKSAYLSAVKAFKDKGNFWQPSFVGFEN